MGDATDSATGLARSTARMALVAAAASVPVQAEMLRPDLHLVDPPLDPLIWAEAAARAAWLATGALALGTAAAMLSGRVRAGWIVAACAGVAATAAAGWAVRWVVPLVPELLPVAPPLLGAGALAGATVPPLAALAVLRRAAPWRLVGVALCAVGAAALAGMPRALSPDTTVFADLFAADAWDRLALLPLVAGTLIAAAPGRGGPACALAGLAAAGLAAGAGLTAGFLGMMGMPALYLDYPRAFAAWATPHAALTLGLAALIAALAAHTLSRGGRP
ncbi:hypothetical protein JQC91_08110 [Jannaschia sp. Os4]|uniref:hypothetical protein n=1 Tax=Jannaschia sp. Os4 TaxID=2807617 RepID=UPI00193A1DDC|nr:hypothetical protein [Jannaschia sp. Os4]MBM2576267.1 hypothetical protein [Jannaschia sp. Os4]